MMKSPSKGFLIEAVKPVKSFSDTSVIGPEWCIFFNRIPFQQKRAESRSQSNCSKNGSHYCNCNNHTQLLEKNPCKTFDKSEREKYSDNSKGGDNNCKPYFIGCINCRLPGPASPLDMFVIFSSTTIASSTTIPIAIDSEVREIMFIEASVTKR